VMPKLRTCSANTERISASVISGIPCTSSRMVPGQAASDRLEDSVSQVHGNWLRHRCRPPDSAGSLNVWPAPSALSPAQ
jgi:hypothetical protein